MIVDDEPLALNILEGYIKQLPHLELAARCSNPLEAISALKNRPVDILFLDINMPVLNGISLLKSLSNPPRVILTTAYRDYALESYDLNVLDYLLKPISLERFIVAVNKYLPINSAERVMAPESALSDERFIYFKADKKMIKIFLNDILWIESLKDYVKVITRDRQIVTYERISYLEEKLPDELFIRIHRSFIVAVTHIQSFSATFVQVNDVELPIGRLYKNEVFRQLNSAS